MKNIRVKLFYVLLTAILCVGAYSLGLNAQKPLAVPLMAEKPNPVCRPDFDQRTPYLDIAYERCPNVDTADDYICIAKLAETTLADADSIAQKIINTTPDNTKFAPWGYAGSASEFMGELSKSVIDAQRSRDAYFDSICNLDMMFIYGGSGMNLEREACRYYYAQQYLNIMEKMQSGL